MVIRVLFLSIIGLSQQFTLFAQVLGCTDPQATNFNPLATKNDGSCAYASISFTPSPTVLLEDPLEEISGMVYWNGNFWGHNDGGNNPWLFAFDTLSGKITKVIKFLGASNVDWEDLGQDENHMYIGDFGNNANGNRKNLLIYKIPKVLLTPLVDTITLQKEQYQTIRFSYEDQTNFTNTGANNTRFDCEAFFCHGQKLHLITKNWVGNYAVHYTLPVDSGTHVAIRQDSLFTSGFMITGADVGAQDQILLTSYTKGGSCAFFLVYGFSDSLHFLKSGNVRRIQLPSAAQIGQLEAVCYINGIRGAIGSERFRFQTFVNVPQNIRRFSTFPWVIDHYKHNTPNFAEEGMMRYNQTFDGFEYFNGKAWIPLGKD